MKFFLTSIFLIILSSCSFDNKSGIWKNSGEVNSKKEDRFKDFETLYTQTKSFNSLIEPQDNLEIIQILDEYLNPISCEIYTLQTDNSYTLNINQNIDENNKLK